MREAKARVVELDDSFPRRGVKSLENVGAAAMGGRHQLDGRPSERGGEEHDVPGLGGQSREAAVEQLVQALGHPERATGLGSRARPDELASELEREERISGGRVLHPGELRTRQVEPSPILQQMMKRTQAQRTEHEMGQTIVREGGLELERRGDLRRPTNGRQEADGLIAQPSKGDLQHPGRRRVDPLQIVERDQHGPALGKRSQHVEKREADRAMVRRLNSRLGQQKRDLERAASQRRQRSCHIVEDRGDQIGKGGEGERGLGLDASVHENETRRPLRVIDPVLPEHRLADPRLAGEDERTRAQLGVPEERLDRVQLLLPPDDSRRHQAPTLSTPTARPARERIPSLR